MASFLTWLAHTSKLAERVKVAVSVRRIFSKGVQHRHFAYLFQVADVAMQTDVHKTLHSVFFLKPILCVKMTP